MKFLGKVPSPRLSAFNRRQRSHSSLNKPTSKSTHLLPSRIMASSMPWKFPLLSFTCEICADEKLTKDSFTIFGCKHSYCKECIGKYVASKLDEKIAKINCPFSGCLQSLDPHHCRSMLPKKVYDKWCDVLCEALISGSEKFYCPFKDCSALLIHDMRGRNEVINESECPYCNRLFCAQCKVPWHSGMVCSEYQKLNENERMDRMLMNLAGTKKWQRCSNCHFYVERTQGCSHMTCRCGYTFCYDCGASLKDHNSNKCKR